MRVHTLEREQVLAGDRGDVFGFFADARNLERITPSFLRFSVVTPGPVAMATGTIIQYRLRLRGIPLTWLTSIQAWEPPHRFIDVQVRGPYALWHHTHEFEEHPDGTLVRDLVRYALPLGPLGTVAHAVFVRRDVERIFAHRRDVLASFDAGVLGASASPRGRRR